MPFSRSKMSKQCEMLSVHADLHPGNIMVDIRRNSERMTGRDVLRNLPTLLRSSSRRKYSLTFVDAGMVAQLTEDEASAFVGLLASLGEGDGLEAAYFTLQFSVENDLSDKAAAAFADDMEALFLERCRGYGTDVDVGHVLRGILGLIRKHQVRIDANFATLVVNCLCVESLARRVCPTYNVLDAAKPLLQNYRKLCYYPNGIIRKGRARSNFVRGSMMLMNWRKSISDKSFFRREKRRHNSRREAIERLLA
jgi:aarF domain-containing kinase